MNEALKAIQWILNDEEITSYISEKEKAHEEFNGKPYRGMLVVIP